MLKKRRKNAKRLRNLCAPKALPLTQTKHQSPAYCVIQRKQIQKNITASTTAISSVCDAAVLVCSEAGTHTSVEVHTDKAQKETAKSSSTLAPKSATTANAAAVLKHDTTYAVFAFRETVPTTYVQALSFAQLLLHCSNNTSSATSREVQTSSVCAIHSKLELASFTQSVGVSANALETAATSMHAMPHKLSSCSDKIRKVKTAKHTRKNFASITLCTSASDENMGTDVCISETEKDEAFSASSQPSQQQHYSQQQL